MGFFDLNLPYHESDRHATDKPSMRGRRLKLALKSMELGFTGVAYNRTIKGVMSESDRCSTTLFPISKLTPSSSSFFASVKFHRQLLNVDVSTPFRQYTRLTVIVDDLAQASALNAGNPILRSYDIVAVRPVNQLTFDHACQTSEVDMISIDFSKKEQFMLKQPMVKAAIKRGVYFEITYSGLIADAQSRRQTISNCKLLVDWTRGKNLIICSAATSATELRGPQDATNLFSLLRLPRERAKASISSNCRSLLANALRKKHFYKEAVRVEAIPSSGQVNPVKSVFDDWLNWDPISSGEGDLLLDEMEKYSAILETPKQSVKSINFMSKLNGLPAHGLLTKDLIYAFKGTLEPLDSDKLSLQGMETEGDASGEKAEEPVGLRTLDEKQLNLQSKDHGEAVELPEGQMSPSGATNIYLASGCQQSEVPSGCVPEAKPAIDSTKIGYHTEDSTLLCSATFSGKSTDSEENVPTTNEKLNYLNDLEQNLVTSKTQLQDVPSLVQQGICLHAEHAHIITINMPDTNIHVPLELCHPSSKSSSPVFPLEPAMENCDMSVCPDEGITADNVLIKNGIENMQEKPLASSHTSYEDGYDGGRQYGEKTHRDDESPLEGSSNTTRNFDEPIDDVMGELKQINSVTDYQGLAKSRTVGRRKGKTSHQPFLFPFKHFLKPRVSKRKHRK